MTTEAPGRTEATPIGTRCSQSAPAHIRREHANWQPPWTMSPPNEGLEIEMKKNVAANVLTAFIYAQGLLCVAAVATVLVRAQGPDSQVSSRADTPRAGSTAIRL